MWLENIKTYSPNDAESLMLSHGRICKKTHKLNKHKFVSSKFVDLQLGKFWVDLKEASFFHLFQFVQLFPQFLFSVLPRLFRKGCQWAKGPRVPIYIYIYKQVLPSVSSFQLITGGGNKKTQLELGANHPQYSAICKPRTFKHVVSWMET